MSHKKSPQSSSDSSCPTFGRWVMCRFPLISDVLGHTWTSFQPVQYSGLMCASFILSRVVASQGLVTGEKPSLTLVAMLNSMLLFPQSMQTSCIEQHECVNDTAWICAPCLEQRTSNTDLCFGYLTLRCSLLCWKAETTLWWRSWVVGDLPSINMWAALLLMSLRTNQFQGE